MKNLNEIEIAYCILIQGCITLHPKQVFTCTSFANQIPGSMGTMVTCASESAKLVKRSGMGYRQFSVVVFCVLTTHNICK